MRRTVEPFRKRRDEIPLSAGGDCLTEIDKSGCGLIARHHEQVAKHMAGAAVVLVRIHASGISAGVLMSVAIPALRIA